MPLMDEKSVKLILTDLPFATTRAKWDKMIDLEKLWKEYERLLSDEGIVLLFAQTPFNTALINSNPKLFKYEWIWEPSHATGFLNAKKKPLSAHYFILVFSKNKRLPPYYPQKSRGHVLKTVKSKSRKSTKSTLWNAHDNHVDYASTERYPRSVLRFPSDRQKISIHETQKPVALLEYLIKTYTKEGDVVLDSCSGSGSLAVACLNTNRRFICMEKDQMHFEKSLEWISQVQEQMTGDDSCVTKEKVG